MTKRVCVEGARLLLINCNRVITAQLGPARPGSARPGSAPPQLGQLSDAQPGRHDCRREGGGEHLSPLQVTSFCFFSKFKHSWFQFIKLKTKYRNKM